MTLRSRFPRAQYAQAEECLPEWLGPKVKAQLTDGRSAEPLALDLRGTKFQQQSGKRFKASPVVKSSATPRLARRAGRPNAVRAAAKRLRSQPWAVLCALAIAVLRSKLATLAVVINGRCCLSKKRCWPMRHRRLSEPLVFVFFCFRSVCKLSKCGSAGAFGPYNMAASARSKQLPGGVLLKRSNTGLCLRWTPALRGMAINVIVLRCLSSKRCANHFCRSGPFKFLGSITTKLIARQGELMCRPQRRQVCALSVN